MTLLLTRSDVADLLPMDVCIEAIEHAFKLHGEGRADPPGILSIHGRGGSFHIKAGILDISRPYFAAKTNTNFPGNPEHFGLPTIQGVLLLTEAERGTPLALMDSAEITALRTGAATAVAARHLAHPEAAVVTVCGCGRQGRLQLCALATVLPLTRAYAVDRDSARAAGFAKEMSQAVAFEVMAADDLDAAVRASDVCVTCTTPSEPER